MKTRINLIPPEFRKKKRKGLFEFRKLNQILIFLLPLILWKILVAGIELRIKGELRKKEKEIVNLNEKISNLKLSAETGLKEKKDKLDVLKEKIKMKEEELRTFEPIYKTILHKKKFGYNLLRTVAESIPEEVWLVELKFDREEKLFSLKGFGLSHDKIGLFLTKLSTYPLLSELYIRHSEKLSEKNKKNQNLILFEAEGKLNY